MCIRDSFGGFDEEEEGTTEQPNGDEAAESDGNDENEEDEEDNDEGVSYTHLRAHETQWRISYGGL